MFTKHLNIRICSSMIFQMIALSFFLMLFSCSSTKKQNQKNDELEQNRREKLSKLEQKEDAKFENPVNTTSQTANENINLKSPETLKAFLARTSEQTYTLSNQDQTMLDEISQPAPDSLEEATLIVGLALRSIEAENIRQAPNKSDSEIKEENIGSVTTSNPQPQGTANIPIESLPSLENNIKQSNIDLKRAIQTNPILKDENLKRILRVAASNEQNSVAFRDEILASLALAETGATFADNPAKSVPTPHLNSSNQISYAQLQNADDILANAQALAFEKDYVAAMNLLHNLKGSILEQTANELNRIFSNQAVNQLRQKAAMSFQQAVGAKDAESKKHYLEASKKLLEEAIQNFPDADQLGVVKENLNLVIKDLDGV